MPGFSREQGSPIDTLVYVEEKLGTLQQVRAQQLDQAVAEVVNTFPQDEESHDALIFELWTNPAVFEEYFGTLMASGVSVKEIKSKLRLKKAMEFTF